MLASKNCGLFMFWSSMFLTETPMTSGRSCSIVPRFSPRLSACRRQSQQLYLVASLLSCCGHAGDSERQGRHRACLVRRRDEQYLHS